MRPMALPLLLLAACGTRGTYVSSGEVPIVVWLLPDAHGPGAAYAHPDRSSRVDLYGPVGIVDERVVYVYRGPRDRTLEEEPLPADWSPSDAVVFEATGERVETYAGVWEGYRRVEPERARPIIAKLDARRGP